MAINKGRRSEHFRLELFSLTYLHQSRYLVKNASIFLKRVNLTRENCLRDGIVETRITHLLIDTRLVGRARLVVVERPTAVRGTGPAVP